jgi:hypothetical protein
MQPRVNLIRFHGVFAQNSKYRARVTLARRGKLKKCHSADEADQTPAEKRASITWAKRLKRVFSIDIETCRECGGDVRIITSIEDRFLCQQDDLIQRIKMAPKDISNACFWPNAEITDAVFCSCFIAAFWLRAEIGWLSC